MNNKLFYVINEDGMRVDARILSKFKLSNNENYITYTYDEYKFHVAANSKELLEVMKENTRIDKTKELILVDKEEK